MARYRVTLAPEAVVEAIRIATWWRRNRRAAPRLFQLELRDILRAAGVTCIKLPARSPDLNAFAERFVLSIKSECLSKLVPLGERHVRHAVAEFIEHYNVERNHRGPREPTDGETHQAGQQ